MTDHSLSSPSLAEGPITIVAHYRGQPMAIAEVDPSKGPVEISGRAQSDVDLDLGGVRLMIERGGAGLTACVHRKNSLARHHLTEGCALKFGDTVLHLLSSRTLPSELFRPGCCDCEDLLPLEPFQAELARLVAAMAPLPSERVADLTYAPVPPSATMDRDLTEDAPDSYACDDLTDDVRDLDDVPGLDNPFPPRLRWTVDEAGVWSPEEPPEAYQARVLGMIATSPAFADRVRAYLQATSDLSPPDLAWLTAKGTDPFAFLPQPPQLVAVGETERGPVNLLVAVGPAEFAERFSVPGPAKPNPADIVAALREEAAYRQDGAMVKLLRDAADCLEAESRAAADYQRRLEPFVDRG